MWLPRILFFVPHKDVGTMSSYIWIENENATKKKILMKNKNKTHKKIT
jgi:hypothetical protein